MEQSQISTDVSVDLDEAVALLRLTPLLQQIPEDDLKKLCEALEPIRYGAGEPIVRMHSEGAGFYIIWKGEAEVRQQGRMLSFRVHTSLSNNTEFLIVNASVSILKKAKVKSKPNSHPWAHKESILKRGDYFGLGIMGPARPKYTVDVEAITEVLCLVLHRERADLLSVASIWNMDSIYERPTRIEKILQLETVGAVGDMKMRTSRHPSPYGPYLQRTLPVSANEIANPNYFGGQLVAQALLAATKTVNAEFLVHSLHSYFVLAADVKFPVVYEVDKIRDGKSFATRHVKAMQNGNIVFLLYASFKRGEEGLEHAAPMLGVPGPEEVVSMDQSFEEFLMDPRLSLNLKKQYAGLKFDLTPFDLRYVNAVDKFQPVKREPRQQMWIRTRVKLSVEQSVHRVIIGYATDLKLLETSLLPHPATLESPTVLLSLDHTIWFHGSFNSADWLLFEMESPVAADGRGLSLGKIYTRDGKLVMTMAQEGVLRNPEGRRQAVAKI